MAVQSEAALENALIHALEQMSYEYVKIEEESNLRDNFKCQLEKHNRKQLAEIGLYIGLLYFVFPFLARYEWKFPGSCVIIINDYFL